MTNRNDSFSQAILEQVKRGRTVVIQPDFPKGAQVWGDSIVRERGIRVRLQVSLLSGERVEIPSVISPLQQEDMMYDFDYTAVRHLERLAEQLDYHLQEHQAADISEFPGKKP